MQIHSQSTSSLLSSATGRRMLAAGCAAGLLLSANSSSAIPIPSEVGYVQSLNGTWRFKLEQGGGYDLQATNGDQPMSVAAAATGEPSQSVDYKEGPGWVDLKVPGNWEMAGLSPATYNQPDNASGFYRFWFEVPKSWKSRFVRLNFDGIQNGAEIWLNGQPVSVDEPSWGRENYHESGWTAFQADLTPQVKFGERNLLAIRVTKNTRSSDLDSGDYFFLGGVYRPVTLFSVPKTHLSDVTVQTRLLAGDRAEIKVLADVEGNYATQVSMKLTGVPGEVSGKIENGRAVLTKIVDHPKLWSAEFPNLYNLTVELKGPSKYFSGGALETWSKQIGIREASIARGVFLVNGVPVKLAGICRHDVSPTEGTAVGPDLWRKDITLMKAANINAIRTSHYPYGSGFYDLCDQMGMYVLDELPYCWCPTDKKELTPAFEQRARETIRRDKNHPSVIVWTIGNENKAGTNLQIIADLVKKLEPTRPRNVSCFNGDKYHVEFSDSHYPSLETIEKDVAHSVKTGEPHILVENPNTWDIRLAVDPGAWERWGTVLQRNWDLCMKEDTIPGTFLWEWQDRAVADKCPTKLYSYFPETGINLMKIKGIVDGFRNPRPWYYDVKMVYSPVKVGDTFNVSGGKISFPVENRYSFTDLSYLKAVWTLERGGKPLATGKTSVKEAPRSNGTAEIQVPVDALARADALLVEFIHPNGNHVAAHRFILKETLAASQMIAALPAGLPVPQFNLVTRTTARSKKEWRKVTTYPCVLTNIVMEPASAGGMAQFTRLSGDIVGGVSNSMVGHVDAQFANGEFTYTLKWAGGNEEVHELGWIFQMPGDCDHFSWNRAARWTVYPAHHIGRASGTATPDSMNVQVTRMDREDAFDFNSTKYDCNWASLTTGAGSGLRLEFDPGQRFHCRAEPGIEHQGYRLFVSQQVCPPDDISKNIVLDDYLVLKPGAAVTGHFRVGSTLREADLTPMK